MNHKTDYDYTSMSTYMTCRRKYDFRINRGLVGNKPPIAADFGKCIHAALDVWYVNHDVEAAIELFKKEYVETEGEDKRTHKMGEWILRNYHTTYQDQPFKLLETEREFCIPIGNGNNLIGRIDKIIEWDGVTWVVDHKTTSQLGPQFMKMHTPNLQFTGYTWAAHRLGYTNCQGVLVDAILVAKGLLDSTSRAKLSPLARDFALRGQQDLDDYVEHITELQREIRLCETGEASWLPNYDACTYYGECPYRKICKEPRDLWDRVIEMDYKVDRWDPREKGDKNETSS